MQNRCHAPPVETRTLELHSGTLRLWVDRAALPLERLCGFASRRSRKRGFVFVSKVLGKHYPVRPALLAEVFDRLAAPLAGLPGPVLLIALAETATGLGQGVHESLLRLSGRDDVLFIHSTRYRLRRPLALRFDECHSHAPAHLLYEPDDPGQRRLFHGAAALVLVDDEISTGNSLANLARAFRHQHDGLRAVHLVCLTDWLGPERRGHLGGAIGVPVTVHSLLQGGFTFTEDPAFDPGPVPDVTGKNEFKDLYLSKNFGRLGRHGPLDLTGDVKAQAGTLDPGRKILVLGTGEFAYPPFRLARWLEEQGCDVCFQSTTRSPLRVERDLQSVLEFTDNYHDAIPNYVYNVAGRGYDQVLIGYETQPLPADHRLAELLAARTIFF